MLPDLAYLQRIQDRTHPAQLLLEPKFLAAQELLFSVVKEMRGSVDFDIADMREVHAIAALGDVKKKRVLDIGCGSTEPYVLTETFRDLYPPFFAEILVQLGADVTGIDIRQNPSAGYDHRVLDCTKGDWMKALQPPYDIVAALSLFNAPESPFENNAELCDHLMDDIHGLVQPEGLAIVTLRDDLFDPESSKEENDKRVGSYVTSKKFDLLHLYGNCAWLQPLMTDVTMAGIHCHG